MPPSANSKRASIGVAIIAKDAAKTLGKCLASIRPYVEQVVVCVDERTTDRTAQVAKRGGAEVYPIKVSDWHECPQHGRVLAQHFAQARQESFTHLRRDLDYWLWIDSDDVLVGGERLADLCAKLPGDAIGVWFRYEYASIETEHGQRQVNTLFNRERLLRTHLNGREVGWTWQGRVHETVSPSVQGRWLADVPEIRVVHQPGTHSTPASAVRNLLLLEIDYEDDPESGRTVFYMGNQYFAMGNWVEAIYWYERLHEVGNNPYELWQADVYRCLGYQRLGALEEARLAAYDALTAVPEHGEPYFQLAAIAAMEGKNEQCEFWNRLGTEREKPPFFVFTNPLDYTFNWRMVQGQALLAQGRVTEARQTYEEAAKVIRDQHVDERLADVRARERNMEQAQAFVNLAQNLNGKALDVYHALPDEVKAYGRTRDVVMPNIINGRVGTQPRIVFWCGQGWEPWAPPSIDTTGIGGSETAVIEIAKRFAKDGWTVDVFNGADRLEGVYEDVGYWDARRYGGEQSDVFVSWRQPAAPLTGKQNVLWCHDLNYGPGRAEMFAAWDKVLGVSAWHAKMLERYYDVPADYVPNGVNLDRFVQVIDAEGMTQIEQRPQKVPFRCVYASSPDRGLATLLAIWPDIVAVEPTAELHVAYGWETIDRMIQSGQRPDLEAFKGHIEMLLAETPNVVWRGRLGQRDLAQLYGESVAWLYPTDFLEVSCISAMEAMAGGAVPISTSCGALPETIGNAGLLVPGPTTSRPYKQLFLQVALGILCEKNNKLIYSGLGMERAKSLTWDAAYARWLSVLGLDGTPATDAPGASEKELIHA